MGREGQAKLPLFYPWNAPSFSSLSFYYKNHSSPLHFLGNARGVCISADSSTYPSIIPLDYVRTNFSLSNYMNPNSTLINEKGELFVSGTIGGVEYIKTSTDSATNYFGGDYDLFIMKYGFPCDTPAGLLAPYEPLNLVASGMTPSTTTLHWSDQSNIEYGYKIYRSLSYGGSYSLIDSIPANTIAYSDTGLSPNTVYWYKVAAYNNVGPAFSNIDSALTLPLGIHESNVPWQAAIYPNPACSNTTLEIYTPANQKIRLIIYDALGRSLYQQILVVQPGKNLFNVQTNSLIPGSYILELNDRSNSLRKELLIIAN